MRVGISLPQIGNQAKPENLILVAQRAEKLGYDSVWVLERLLWPITPREPYPATDDGLLPEQYQIVFDPLETLAFVAAHTKTIRLGTSVLVLPYHSPIQLARRIATLDMLSSGRVDVGVGVGWSRDEFEAAGTPFTRRGARVDEFLQVMIDLWTKDPVSFDGQFYRIAESRVGPKPVQKPHPPLYIAGHGQHAFERMVRYGEGWNPAGLPSFEVFQELVRQFHLATAGHPRRRFEIVLRVFPVVFDHSIGESRKPLMGTVEEIRSDCNRLSELGVTELILSPPEIGWVNSETVDAGLARMEQLIEVCR
jgi:probable F420-dependent oxidoreductase